MRWSAGDFQLSSASIQTTDLDGRPCRAAGRGGLGAVMGAKGLKALIVSRKGKTPDPLASPEGFKTAARAYADAVKADEFSGEILPQLGTACLVEAINGAGRFPPAMPARASSMGPRRSVARPWPG
jgi:aldehyde:ferredoxin oxidoreductase